MELESKYKKGDIIKIKGSENWKFIEGVEWIDIDGDEPLASDSGWHYHLRGGEIVAESEIVDIMDALPD